MRRSGVLRVGLPRAVLLFLACTPVVASADLGAFEGTWVRTQTERDDAAREAEILRVTEPMPFLARGIARSLMSRRMRPAPRIRLSCEGGRLLIDFPEKGEGGNESAARELPVEARKDGTLEESWSRDSNAHGTTIWELSMDAAELVLRISAFNPHYQGAMHYIATYRRDATTGELPRTCDIAPEQAGAAEDLGARR